MSIIDSSYINKLAFELLGPSFTVVVLLLIAFAILQKFIGRSAPNPYLYRIHESVMTKAEGRCFQALIGVVGNDFYVFPQLHLSTLIDHKVKGQNWGGAFRHINGKSIDFVLCDKSTLYPRLAIELDDWSHAREDRQERDKEVERILAYAKLPLLRITDTTDLYSKISAALST